MSRTFPWFPIAALLCVGACNNQDEHANKSCLSYREEIASLFDEHCNECHDERNPAGGYSTQSYAGVLGVGSDGEENATAGDRGSLLLTMINPRGARDPHRGFAKQYKVLFRWLVDCDLSYFRSQDHTGGIMNPLANDFHGRLLRDKAYDFGECATCHGKHFEGGKSKSSCLSCHIGGPKSCQTCHSTPPSSGAHAVHVLGGDLHKNYRCEECHHVPDHYLAPGHILLAEGVLDPPPVEVSLGNLATTKTSTRKGVAHYDQESNTCWNVYCHGDAFSDAHATHPTPQWQPLESRLKCGSCHGLPPTGHIGEPCNGCHPQIVSATSDAPNPTLHINGVLNLRADQELCSSCHGMAANPAPPRDLRGNTLPTARGVGAHQSHLQAKSLRGPVACAECHLVPRHRHSPGHIDSRGPAEVFPLNAAKGLAWADGAVPFWDAASATCAGTYCHGNGDRLAADQSESLNRTPTWTRTNADEAACGACHGIPPRNEFHLVSWTRTECAACHTSVVDAFGGIVVVEGTSLHMDGKIDF